MLTLNELTRWTGLTLFEMDMHLVALFATTMLVVLKWHFLMSFSLLQVFAPLFTAVALNFYFLAIVFVRTVLEDRVFKRAVASNAFHFFRTAMIALFEVFLCHKVDGDLEPGKVAVESPYWVIMMPVWMLLIAFSVHACRLL